jgi:hypothetical protein
MPPRPLGRLVRVNSGLLEASSETATIKNDAGAGPAATDTETDFDRQAGPVQSDPGPFQDIPRGTWIIFLSAWASLFALFILFFTDTLAAAFVVTVAALFGLMAFGLPAVMAAQGRCEGHECGDMIQTRTGPLSVAAAGTQIVLIPIAALIGLAAFIVLAM